MPVATSARNPHMAEECADEFCPRLPCRMFREGYRRGLQRGYDDGWRDGYPTGYTDGYGAGAAACSSK
jgi:hypothetical protein